MNRPDLFVYVALACAWLLVGAWAFRISRKVDRLQASIEMTSGPDPGRGTRP